MQFEVSGSRKREGLQGETQVWLRSFLTSWTLAEEVQVVEQDLVKGSA